jgi:hypothetical protein
MSLQSVLGSDMTLSVVTSVLGCVWAFFKSSDWFRALRDRRYFKALEALEAGVEVTYRTYVRAIKEAREDGKLTEEEIAVARQRARAAAIEFGRMKGIDVLREVGEEYVNLWIGKIVKRAKQK